MRSLVLAGVLAGGIAACATIGPTPAEPLDLEAIAKQLDPGSTPRVLDLVPAALVEKSNDVLAGVSTAAIDEVLRWNESGVLAAIGVLQQSDEARSTPAALLREIIACWRIASDNRNAWLQVVIGPNPLDRTIGFATDAGSWEKAVREPALRRARALSARLLREHGMDAAATELLTEVSDLDTATTWRMRDEAIRRLGDRATAFDWMRHARAALENLDLERAEASLDAAGRAARLPSVAARRYVARALLDVRERLLTAKQHTESAKQPDLAGQIARLRVLQAANPEAAVEESRQLVAASVAHALPFSILASASAVAGRNEEAMGYLAQAAQRPGYDVLAASIEVTLRILPQLRQLQQGPADEAVKKLQDELKLCDAVVAEDPSEPAVLYRWWRKERHWLEPSAVLPVSDLESAIALQASLPDSVAAYSILLTAALLADDAAKARTVLLRPVPAALAALHDVAWLRASIYVVRDLREDRALVPAELDAVLGDLERVQQDPTDAAYLRGVRTWWEATRAGADEELPTKARKFFASAQREFGQRGLWRAASAVSVVDAALGQPVDYDALQRASTQEGLANPSSLVAVAVLVFADPRIDMDKATKWAEWSTQIDQKGSLAVALSACAEALNRLGDASGARVAAMDALKASADARLPLDRGVVSSGEFGCGFAFKLAGAVFQANLASDLWVVPRVMNREQLQQIVDGK
jgi:tetratricopeptide (TPR) repeat protein